MLSTQESRKINHNDSNIILYCCDTVLFIARDVETAYNRKSIKNPERKSFGY